MRLTEDHKPNQPEESARIVAAGGHVTTPYARGTENVPRLNGQLSVSRALGNAPFKRSPEGAALSHSAPPPSSPSSPRLQPSLRGGGACGGRRGGAFGRACAQGAHSHRVRHLRASRERWPVGCLLRSPGRRRRRAPCPPLECTMRRTVGCALHGALPPPGCIYTRRSPLCLRSLVCGGHARRCAPGRRRRRTGSCARCCYLANVRTT